MKPIKFPSLASAQAATAAHINKVYPNVFQDARSVARIKINEYATAKGKPYWCVQFGDYGPFMGKTS